MRQVGTGVAWGGNMSFEPNPRPLTVPNPRNSFSLSEKARKAIAKARMNQVAILTSTQTQN